MWRQVGSATHESSPRKLEKCALVSGLTKPSQRTNLSVVVLYWYCGRISQGHLACISWYGRCTALYIYHGVSVVVDSESTVPAWVEWVLWLAAIGGGFYFGGVGWGGAIVVVAIFFLAG